MKKRDFMTSVDSLGKYYVEKSYVLLFSSGYLGMILNNKKIRKSCSLQVCEKLGRKLVEKEKEF